MNITRRDLILAGVCWREILSAQTRKDALNSPAPARFTWFDAATAAEIEAIAAQIIPDDGTPGAKKAGVIWFIDRALAGYDQGKRDLYTYGLEETQQRRTGLFPGSTTIALLSDEQQIQLLKAIENTEFFRQVRFHTILGFFGHPMHGGNRDMVGWKLLGIQHAGAYKPPFGYYDAEAQEKVNR